MDTKYIFITGGVMSSLGKGILTSSIGRTLKARELKVTIIKFDPYLNVDPGLQNPYQHGEVFVTNDGAETDLDLGHYERFLDEDLSRLNNVTAGSVYSELISKERRGEFLGATVQTIPHLTNEIKSRIYKLKDATNPDVIIGEIGGTVGDIESLPFLEAIREFRMENSPHNVLFIHLTYLPHIKATDELKTKPTQHSVAELRRVGIQPDLIVCRSDKEISQEIAEKISLFCDVKKERIYSVIDVDNVYEVPLMIEKKGLSKTLLKLGELPEKEANLDEWEEMVNTMNNLTQGVNIGIVGKYTAMCDAYLSLVEALKHAQVKTKVKVNIKWIAAEVLEKEEPSSVLSGLHGILIPGGFGKRGIEGMINASKYARENNIPYFGICLGLQIAVIDFARASLRLTNANSSEFDPTTPYPVIDLMQEQRDIQEKGATMRLGAFPCKITQSSLAHRLYGKEIIYERHRHRYEFNNSFRQRFEMAKMKISGTYMEKGLVEIIELIDHPFFIACQFHPELISRPLKPHPLFSGFVSACYNYRQKVEEEL
jgi:CTP synthase